MKQTKIISGGVIDTGPPRRASLSPPVDPCVEITVSGVKWPAKRKGSTALTFNSNVEYAWVRFQWPGTLRVGYKNGCVKVIKK